MTTKSKSKLFLVRGGYKKEVNGDYAPVYPAIFRTYLPALPK
jgi:hypothetical protein